MEFKGVSFNAIKTETEGEFNSPTYFEYLTYYYLYSEQIKWKIWENITIFGPLNKETVRNIQGNKYILYLNLDIIYSALHIELDQAIEIERNKVWFL